MKTQTFSSCLASKMEAFCALRRLSGTDYFSQAYLLGHFDAFLVQEGFTSPYLSRALIDKYMNQSAHLQSKSKSNRLSVIRQFCVHLSNSQPKCYIPTWLRSKHWRYIPYIFTVEEIGLLRASALKLKPLDSLRSQALSTIYGLLFATGLRIGETLALNVEDLTSRALLVRKGKFHKERLVPITERTFLALKEYLLLREARSPLANDSPIFVNIKGKRLSDQMVRVPFNKSLLETGIYSGQGQKPRLHDLRHSFAVTRLLQWYQDGEDINKRLPLLATYMGHVDIQSTQKYIHATPQLQQEFNQRTLDYFKNNILDLGGE